MNLQFIITDYTVLTTGGLPTTTVIQEPVGWDAIKFHLKRDPVFHGFFEFVDDSLGSLQFDGNGYGVLKNAYNTNGPGAIVYLRVQYQCSDEPFTTLYKGQFDFSMYKEFTGDRCYVEVHVANDTALMRLMNRQDQECDLDLLASFDQLPVSQTVITSATFGDLAPNQIEVGQLLNGLQQGSKITFTGTAHNNTSYTVASAVPDYLNVQESAPLNIPSATSAGPSSGSIQLTGSDSNFFYATLVFNMLIYGVKPGDSIALSGSGSIGGADDITWGVVSAMQKFNYTLFQLKVGISTSPAPNDCSGAGFILGGPFNFPNTATSTIITIAETIATPETITNCSLTAVFLKNNMPAYAGLNKIVSVPPKIIQMQSRWQAAAAGNYPLNTPTGSGGSFDGLVIITPDWPNIQSEIDETDVGTAVPNYSATVHNPPDTMIYWRQESLPCSGINGVLKLNFSGLFADSAGNPSPPWNIHSLPLQGGGTAGPSNDKQFQIVVIRDVQWAGTTSYSNTDARVIVDDVISFASYTNTSFSYSKEVDNISLEPGEYIWIFFSLYSGNNTSSAPVLALNPGSFFQFTINTGCGATPASVYMLNEVLSRCAEYYTNGAIEVYSDYFGRPDAQPQPSATIGCGALEAITNGLKIRGAIVGNNSSIPKMTASLKSMFDGLNAIHNTGMCLEADPVRGGSFMRLRIEPFDHFFNSTVLMTCHAIMEFTRELDMNLIYSTFKTGYSQFETWNNNGLYDIFGSRTYRTALTQLRNPLDRTCQFIASDYAIEFTRRLWGLTTSDGRYDSNLFILCLTEKSQQQVVWIAANTMMNVGIDLTTSPWNWATGNSVTVSNTASNNFTRVIASIFGGTLNGVPYSLITFTTGVLAFEVAPGADLVNGATTITDARFYFIPTNGAAILFDILYDLQIEDTIVFANTAHNNGAFLINGMGLISTTDMLLITASTAFNTTAATDAAAVITDTTRPFTLVEQGIPLNGANVLGPASVFNYRISPAHNALRHFKTLAMSYRDPANALAIFTHGKGNIYAIGELSGDCVIEGAPLGEGANLSIDNFADPATDAIPLYYPELVKFEYPLSYDEFLVIAANPYGLIGFQQGTGAVEYGWIEDLQYSPYEGMGSFVLRPRVA